MRCRFLEASPGKGFSIKTRIVPCGAVRGGGRLPPPGLCGCRDMAPAVLGRLPSPAANHGTVWVGRDLSDHRVRPPKLPTSIALRAASLPQQMRGFGLLVSQGLLREPGAGRRLSPELAVENCHGRNGGSRAGRQLRCPGRGGWLRLAGLRRQRCTGSLLTLQFWSSGVSSAVVLWVFFFPIVFCHICLICRCMTF